MTIKRKWQLACLDMAGTTVRDDGLVEEAFTAAIAAEEGMAPGSPGYEEALRFVRDTMGQSKIDVFRALLADEPKAQAANLRFEDAYAALVRAGRIAPIEGAVEAIEQLREAGIQVALTTGFARPTQDAILDALGWRKLVSLALCPGDAGRGRPYPDMILTAILRLGVSDVRAVAVAGDTPSDIRSGSCAGASVVAGVLTGASKRDALLSAGATHVLDAITALPGLLRAAP
ncbi:phosphonatase-like hydrolase [Pendulispora albinea]|uniref:Phosphonatase-like hydrolase n=1 Tax=Pendulispora albinea TaxID=2741071 RepID=A0ABZ2M0M4_9BACT